MIIAWEPMLQVLTLFIAWLFQSSLLAAKLVSAKVPILYVAGEQDEMVPFLENGGSMQKGYKRLGGLFELIMHDGGGNHPYSSLDSRPVIDFIERYDEFDIQLDAIHSLKPGDNQIAVHGHRGKHPSYFDIALVQERH
jgi:hypothetical protein